MNPSRVGIVGAGQLARMMIPPARALGIEPWVLAGSPADPAAQLEPRLVIGDAHDEQTLRQLLEQVELATFESEFVEAGLLERAARGCEVRFVPSLEALATIQDKLEQKRLLDELSIPNARYALIESPPADEPIAGDALARIHRSVSELAEQWGGAAVLKWAKRGYDGKGTLFFPTDRGDDRGALKRFFERARSVESAVYAEQRIAFARELAIVAVHGVGGELRCFPLVISEQRDGICRRVLGPAVELGVRAELERIARDYAGRIGEALPLCGAFAIELFEGEDGALLVNELAPRVHNSGHYTMDACATGQFENHLRAICGLELGAVEAKGLFLMDNLIADAPCAAPRPPVDVAPPARVHWYGKAPARPGRKMGHINALVTTRAELDDQIAAVERYERAWREACRD